MPHHILRARVRRGRSLTVALALGLCASPLAWLALPAGDSGAQTPGAAATVHVSATTDLTDGQRVEITITPARAGVKVVESPDDFAEFCRDGETYTSTKVSNTVVDTSPDLGGKCLGQGLTQTALSPLSSQVGEIHAFPDGTGRGSMNVGIGTVRWTSTGGHFSGEREVTCSPAQPCRLVVQYMVNDNGTNVIVVDSSTLLTFRDSDQSAAPGCAGVAPDAPRSVGTERMGDAWRDWTSANCRSRGADAVAPTLSVFSDEKSGLEDFAAGNADIVYTAAGYPSPLDTPAKPRGYLATPTALNATVLAVAGGHVTLTPSTWPLRVPQPFTEVKMTIGDVATLLGQSGFALDVDAVKARNPELNTLGSNCCVMAGTLPQIPGTPDARSLFGSTFFKALAPAAWVTPGFQDAGPRGVSADFSTAVPSFLPNFSTRYSSGAALQKSVFSLGLKASADQFGALWALTDYSTAIRLGMTPVSIQFQPGGEFVKPTPATIAAGANALTRQPDGLLEPDPAKLSPGAYPLTMVEYALTPSEALPAERCASQPLLAPWLRYITGPGQGILPDGLVPLTPALKGEAAAAIDKVAALPGCAPPGTTPPAATPTGTGGTGGFGGAAGFGGTGDGFGSASDSFGSGLDADSGADGAASLGATAAVPASNASRRAAAKAVAEAEIETPPFLGIASLSTVAAPLALLMVVLLTSGAALVTSGRPVPPGVAAAPGKIARTIRPRRRRR